jgi:hypothetical protein
MAPVARGSRHETSNVAMAAIFLFYCQPVDNCKIAFPNNCKPIAQFVCAAASSAP